MSIWNVDNLKQSVLILGGERGSGKSELAVNLAVKIRSELGKNIKLLDLDPIKPVFRSRDQKSQLEKAGVELISTPISSLDLPTISGEIAGVLQAVKNRPPYFTIVDLAGEPEGARMLGAYRDYLKDHYDFFLVYNGMRPFSQDFEDTRQWAKQISEAVRLSFTGLVNNSHLMQQTTPEIIIQGSQMAARLASAFGIPLVFHALKQDLLKCAPSPAEPLFPLELKIRPPWDSPLPD